MKKLVSLETVVAEKEAELTTLRTALTAARTMGYDLQIVAKGDKVTIPSAKPSSTTDDKRGKYQRASSYTQKDFKEMRQHILNLAGTQEHVNTNDVYKYLRKATRLTAAKKSQIFWQLTTLFNNKKLNRVSEGKYSLPQAG